MKRSAFLTVGLAAVAVLGTTSIAFATPDTGPDTAACAEAKLALAAALAPVVEFAPDVYPGDKAPALADLTPALLEEILDDPDLGGGARGEVEAALAAHEDATAACTAPPAPPTTTVAPTPTDTAPVPDPADDEDDFDQVGTPPAGGVDTGAR